MQIQPTQKATRLICDVMPINNYDIEVKCIYLSEKSSIYPSV